MTHTLSFRVFWNICLGGGGEADVFLGRCKTTGQWCAIKVSNSTSFWTARAALARELERWRRAAGDRVVGLVGYNLESDPPFIAFELAKAGTLGDEIARLRREGKVYHPVRALERIKEVLLSVGLVHVRGVVHRDIKPGNLLVFSHVIKVNDFGTGRTLNRPRHLQTLAFIGTPKYAAPEQKLRLAVDHRADLYAIGCILYEMLMGDVPDPLAGRFVRPSVRYPNVLPQLDDFVSSLLNVLPSQRPMNALQAIRRVEEILQAYGRARRIWLGLGLSPSPY